MFQGTLGAGREVVFFINLLKASPCDYTINWFRFVVWTTNILKDIID